MSFYLAIGRTKRHTGGVPNAAMDCLANIRNIDRYRGLGLRFNVVPGPHGLDWNSHA
jgi:hypothetical protein